MADPAEWAALAGLMWRRGLCVWLPEELIFSPHGIPVVSGLFGVPKPKDVPRKPGLIQLRLICNLIPSNAYFRVARGEVDELPYSEIPPYRFW